METKATCITPKPTISGEITHETQERETWFSDIPNNGGFAFTYKADSNQIAFLQMLSSKASQNVTYHCSNSVAHYHDRRQHHRKSIALQSWNDLEIRNRGKFRYNVIKDDCQVLVITFRNFYFLPFNRWFETFFMQRRQCWSNLKTFDIYEVKRSILMISIDFNA